MVFTATFSLMNRQIEIFFLKIEQINFNDKIFVVEGFVNGIGFWIHKDI